MPFRERKSPRCEYPKVQCSEHLFIYARLAVSNQSSSSLHDQAGIMLQNHVMWELGLWKRLQSQQFTVTIHPSIHPLLFILIRAGANPSCHRSRGGVHPGQVESVTSQEKYVLQKVMRKLHLIWFCSSCGKCILITVTVGWYTGFWFS